VTAVTPPVNRPGGYLRVLEQASHPGGDVFETVLGIPAHPLLLHAAVVFVPLLVAAALAFALVPPVRSRIAWAVVLLALAGPLSALFTKLSGDAFRRRLIRRHLVSPQVLTKISTHQSYGNMTLYLTVGLGLLTLLLVGYVLAGARRAGGSGGAGVATAGPGATALLIVLVVGTVALALASGYYVFRTGDTGAHIVWKGF
jgi:hypothetical protein